jgi:hypothetical protein
VVKEMWLSLLILYGPVGQALEEQNAPSEFADLGKLLLLGFVAAAVLGLALTIIRIRLRDKKPPESGFISINSLGEDK